MLVATARPLFLVDLFLIYWLLDEPWWEVWGDSQHFVE